MQKSEPKLTFAHPESGPSRAETGPFDILRQPIGADWCGKPCVTTPESGCGWKRMEIGTMKNTTYTFATDENSAVLQAAIETPARAAKLRAWLRERRPGQVSANLITTREFTGLRVQAVAGPGVG